MNVAASTNNTPPFARKNNNYFITNWAEGRAGSASKSGWMAGDDFRLFMEHFIKNSPLWLQKADVWFTRKLATPCYQDTWPWNGVTLLSSHLIPPISCYHYTHQCMDLLRRLWEACLTHGSEVIREQTSQSTTAHPQWNRRLTKIISTLDFWWQGYSRLTVTYLLVRLLSFCCDWSFASKQSEPYKKLRMLHLKLVFVY